MEMDNFAMFLSQHNPKTNLCAKHISLQPNINAKAKIAYNLLCKKFGRKGLFTPWFNHIYVKILQINDHEDNAILLF